MDQAENDLHITVMSMELVRRLTNKLFENNEIIMQVIL